MFDQLLSDLYLKSITELHKSVKDLEAKHSLRELKYDDIKSQGPLEPSKLIGFKELVQEYIYKSANGSD